MKKHQTLILLLTLSLFSCQKEIGGTDPIAQDIDQLIVDGNFDWNSAKNYTLEITPYASTVLLIKDQDGKVLQKAFVHKDQVYSTQIQLPAFQKVVIVEFLEHTYTIQLTHNKIQYTLN